MSYGPWSRICLFLSWAMFLWRATRLRLRNLNVFREHWLRAHFGEEVFGVLLHVVVDSFFEIRLQGSENCSNYLSLSLPCCPREGINPRELMPPFTILPARLFRLTRFLGYPIPTKSRQKMRATRNPIAPHPASPHCRTTFQWGGRDSKKTTFFMAYFEKNRPTPTKMVLFWRENYLFSKHSRDQNLSIELRHLSRSSTIIEYIFNSFY